MKEVSTLYQSSTKECRQYLKALELYKKVKGDTKSSSYKKSIGLLKKLNDEKKKLLKEMDIAVSSKMRNVGYEGPLD